MLNLDPGKLLVIAVVAIILLGPDQLPQVARQVGGAWRSFNEFRHRMESEVRSTMPDLPSTSEIARLARSPSALLNHLSNMGTDEARRRTRSRSRPDVGTTGPAADAPPSPERVGTPGGRGRRGRRRGGHDVPRSTTHAAPPSATPPDVTPAPRSPDVVVPGDPTLN